MKEEMITKADVAEAIVAVKNILESQTHIYEQEEIECEYSTDNQQDNEDYDDFQDATANLSNIPESSWTSLKVSKKSTFGDIVWDFQDEGSPIYKSYAIVAWDQYLDEETNLTNSECHPLFQLLRSVLFYCLPQNSIIITVRSYNSVISKFRGLVKIARFLYGRRIYVDNFGNGSYVNANVLTEKDILCCIEEQPTISGKFLVASTLRLWQNLSASGYLPEQYRININVITDDIVRELEKKRNEDARSFMPISLEALSVVVPYCVNIVEKHSEEILSAYKTLYPIFCDPNHKLQVGISWEKVINYISDNKSGLWSIDDFYLENGSMDNAQKYKLLKLIRSHSDWPTYRKKHFTVKGKDIGTALNQKILNVARELGVDICSIDGGKIFYNLNKMRNFFISVFYTLRDACLIIICLVTGMRLSELRHIEANKAWCIPGTDDDYRLKFTVFKTSQSSQGDTVVIPIPEIAFKAYKVLERLTKNARQFGNTSYLCININIHHLGEQMRPHNFNRCLDRFWQDLGIEEDIHPHMFRKTLAMFAIYQDPRNITVIKYLFSHKSLAMTLAYIVKIPGMSDDLKLAILENNVELLAEVLVAAKNEKIGGKCGLRIKEQLKSSKLLARLNDDGRETLTQYVDSLLEQGLRILHRCPMNVVCTNLHDSVVHISPELCDCEVTNCDYAIFTESSVPDLLEQIRFHEQWITRPSMSEDQIKFSKRTIHDCLERLEEVQGREYLMAEFPVHYGLVA